MIEDKKYALLDTDFLYKSYLAQDDAQNTLADIVISFQEYEFFCHSIGFGNLSNLDDWLSKYGIPNYHSRYFYSIKYNRWMAQRSTEWKAVELHLWTGWKENRSPFDYFLRTVLYKRVVCKTRLLKQDRVDVEQNIFLALQGRLWWFQYERTPLIS